MWHAVGRGIKFPVHDEVLSPTIVSLARAMSSWSARAADTSNDDDVGHAFLFAVEIPHQSIRWGLISPRSTARPPACKCLLAELS